VGAASPGGRAGRGGDQAGDNAWVMLDGRLFFVVGYTPGGAPYGMFADEMSPYGDALDDAGT
jgi:hypothetical protein